MYNIYGITGPVGVLCCISDVQSLFGSIWYYWCCLIFGGLDVIHFGALFDLISCSRWCSDCDGMVFYLAV